MCVETTKVCLFKCVKKNVQIKHKKYGKGGHRNLAFSTLELILRCYLRNRSGSLLYSPARQPV